MNRHPNDGLPSAILFACNNNTVRSPMAAAIMRHLFGKFVRVESVGVQAGGHDLLAAVAMEEIGIVLDTHRPRRFEDLEESPFDLVVTLSPEAQHRAMELARDPETRIESRLTIDPTAAEGTREQRLDAYREARDALMRRLTQRFACRSAPGI